MISQTPIGNTTELENEVNKLFKMNSDLNRNDLQIYAEISDKNLVPISFGYNPDGTINIYGEDELALNKTMYVGSKRQFLYKRFNIGADTLKLDLNVDEFKTGWDTSRYVVFRNGYMMNSSMYLIYVPMLDNYLVSKVLYTMTKFKKGDRIDIFYIESEDMFSPVPINRDVYLCIKRQYANENDQRAVKIPYPYSTYPRGQKMFFVCDKNGYYLDNRYDYQISEDDEYIFLRESNTLRTKLVDYLIFTFPYAKQDWEWEDSEDSDDMEGEKSGTSFFIAYSVSASNGRVYFNPIFDQYTIDKRCLLLFGNTTFIDPERYKIIDNGTIEFVQSKAFGYGEETDDVGGYGNYWDGNQNVDIEHSPYVRYTMVIFRNQNVFLLDNLEFAIDVRQVEATQDEQQTFMVPDVDIDKPSFLAFVGSLNFDQKDRFIYNQDLGRIDIQNSEDFVEKGRVVTFIFYKSTIPGALRTREVMFKFIKFDVPDDTGKVKIPSEDYTDLSFNERNLILFLNGVYLSPDRYSIGSNIISMNDPLDDALDDTKTLVGVYLMAYQSSKNINDADGPYMYTDMRDDHDWIIFDELYATPYLPPHVDKYIEGGGLNYVRGTLNYFFFNNRAISLTYSRSQFNPNGNDNRGTIRGNFGYSSGTFNGSNQPDGHGRISCTLNNRQIDPPREFRIGISNGEQGRRRGFLSDGFSDGRDPFGWVSGGTKEFSIDNKKFNLYELSALNNTTNILEIKGNSTFPQIIVTLSGTSFLFDLPNGRYGHCTDAQRMWDFFDSHVDQTLEIVMSTP